MGTRRRLDRLSRRIAAEPVCAPTLGGQCHSDPAHVAEVLMTMIACGAWSVDDVGGQESSRAGLSAAELRDFMAGASPAAGEW